MKLKKTFEALFKEYDGIKYANLHDLEQPYGDIVAWCGAIDEYVHSSEGSLGDLEYIEKNAFMQSDFLNILKRYRVLIEQDLYSIINENKIKSLCELGSGLGQNINFAVEAGMRVLSLEISKKALAVQLKKFSGHENFKCGSFNVFGNFDCLDDIQSGSLVFSSYVFSLNPILSEGLFAALLRKNPHSVIHYEPIFELHETPTTHDKNVSKYITENDYNTNLLSILKKLEAQGDLEIVRVEKNFFGINPNFPCSILQWRPR